MKKLNRNDFRETMTMLIAAHIAAKRSGLHDIKDDVVDEATKLAVKIFEKAKKFPKNYKKSSNLELVDYDKEIGL